MCKYLAIVALINLGLQLNPCYAETEQPQPITCEKQISSETCTKIGQMLIIGFGGMRQDAEGKLLWQDPNGTEFTPNSDVANAIKDNHVGGIILFSKPLRQNKTYQYIRERNIRNPEQLSKLIADLKQYSAITRQQRGLEDLELMVSIDQEGGMVNRLSKDLGFQQKTIIPQALGKNEEEAIQSNKLNLDIQKKALEDTFQYASEMGEELKKLGFNVNFAPCVDLNINPLNAVLGSLGRSFSSKPEIVTDQANAFIKAFNKAGIISTIKHFPGHGSSSDDSHLGLVDVTNVYQKEIELIPYQKLIKQGYADLIMTTHVINGQFDKTQCKAGQKEDPNTWCPGTMSYKTLTILLRDKLGFKGVIVSDDMTMGAIANEYPLEFALEKAINAGVEMFIVSNNNANQTALMVNTIAKLIKDNKVKEAQIDKAYNNIKRLKNRMKGIK